MWRWQLSASAVTIVPSRESNAGSSGTAVISLDLPPTASWPRTSRCSTAQALTRCRGEASAARPRGGGGGARARPVEGAAQRLAVDRDHASRGLGEAPHEAQEAGVELRRVEQPEHPAERVVRGNAGRQAEELA